jgi:hypothetical protein
MVRFSMTKIKGHVAIWWDMLQKDMVDIIKEKIRTWRNMVSKIKEKFIPINYRQNFCKHVQNLRKKETYVREYKEGFLKLSLRLEIK